MDLPSSAVHSSPVESALVILESVTDAFFLLDREFRFVYLNGTARKLLQRDDLPGKHIWTEFPAARGTEFQQAYERAMFESVRVEFVEYYPAPLDRWYEVRAFPSERGVSVYFHDITARRHAEAAYARSRDQMELVVRGADVGVWYCPLPFDELLWDEKVKEHFHLPPDARVTIDTFYERLHPDDRERTRAAIAKSVAERTHYDIDYRTVSPDGQRTRWIRAVGRAFYGPDGTPVRFDGVTIDASDRKLAELAVRASEERYRLATRATNDVVWDWLLAADEVQWNESLATHFGYPKECTVTAAAFWLERIHTEDRARVEYGIRAVIDDPTKDTWESEYRFARADGSWADVLDRSFVLRDASGRAVRMIGAIQDLSARKAVERERERVIAAERAAREEAERQSRIRDEFLATLSHELRTPLTAILGWAQILSNRPHDASTARALAVISRNAAAQARLVEDLLDTSRMLAGGIRLDARRVALGALVAVAIDAARPTADARGVTLVARIAPGADGAEVVGDAARLQQVLWNLLSNAVKFSRAGGRVKVALECTDAAVVLTVQDDGQGIAPDFLPFVFDRFRQAEASTSRQHGGLGLGLSIVKHLVELHGGTVQADSAGPGLGSTFTVQIPRAPAAPRADGAEAPTREASADGLPRSMRAPGVDLRGVRALVVDDEPDGRSEVSRALEAHGAVATVAESVGQALEILQASPFDVLLVDVDLVRDGGAAVLSRYAGVPSAMPAVALTPSASAGDRARAATAGFTLYTAKPVEPADVATTVAAAVGRL